MEQIPFSWLESNGWIILSGSVDSLSEIRAQSLSRLNADGALAYISLADDMGDALMDDMMDLGAPTGYLVDLEDSDNNAIYERLINASMIIVEPGRDIDGMRRLMTQTVIRAFKEALQSGSILLFEGIAATLAGELIVRSDGKITKGLQFVTNSHIMPDTTSILETEDAERVYVQHPETVFIAIEKGSALVLGPDRHIETWGDRQITISLGSESQNSDLSDNNI